MQWLVTLLGFVVRRSFILFYALLTFHVAQKLAVAVAAITLGAALTLGMATAIKAAIVAVRVSMPGSLGLATYFLPSNINVMISVFITIRVAHFIWSWSMRNLAKYVYAHPF